MPQRSASLMDLEKVLRNAAAGATRGGRRTAGTGTAPARRSAPAGETSRARGRVAAQAFDVGEPITVRGGGVRGSQALRTAPARPAAKAAEARQRSVFVEPFEEGGDDEEIAPAEEPDTPAEEEAAPAEDQAGDTDELVERAGVSDTPAKEDGTEPALAAARPVPTARAASARSKPSASHAEQIAAFQREVEALAAKRPAQESAGNPPGAPSAGADGDEEPSAPEAKPRHGHQVFDDMARGMDYASEFRLPPVDVRRLFRDLDQRIDAETPGGPGARNGAAAALTSEPPDDEVLARDLASIGAGPGDGDGERAARVLADQLGTGALRKFAGADVLLGEGEARSVLAFFWPDLPATDLGPLAENDRGFAQALLVEAADASHTMGIVETLYRTFYGKVAAGFDDVKEMLKKVAKKAIEDRWYRKIETLQDAEGQPIYETVRATVARNHRTTYEARRQTGELTGY